MAHLGTPAVVMGEYRVTGWTRQDFQGDSTNFRQVSNSVVYLH
jgi:hypothetical protein